MPAGRLRLAVTTDARPAGAAAKAAHLLGEAGLRAYGLAGSLASPAAGLLLAWRARRGKEDAARGGERRGAAGIRRPDGALAWVHAASVGETLSVVPLIAALAEKGLSVLLTTGTLTSAAVAADRLPAGAIHQFAPIDAPRFVGRFLRHWRPDLAIFAESELWPAAIEGLRRRGTPLVLANARMSDRSFRKWRLAAPFAAALLRRVDLCLAQAPGDAGRFQALGATNVREVGNLKFDAPLLPVDAARVARLRGELAGRPVLLAASTHPGEEDFVLAASRIARERVPGLVTILAPRHPARGAALEAEVTSAGFTVARHDAGGRPSSSDVFIADSIGEMGLWFSLADLAVLGGSISRHGGQNPIEPAKLGVPILHGPHVGNFSDVYASLARTGAVRQFGDVASLANSVVELLGNPAERDRMVRSARSCVEGATGATRRTVELLAPYLAMVRYRNAAHGA